MSMFAAQNNERVESRSKMCTTMESVRRWDLVQTLQSKMNPTQSDHEQPINEDIERELISSTRSANAISFSIGRRAGRHESHRLLHTDTRQTRPT